MCWYLTLLGSRKKNQDKNPGIWNLQGWIKEGRKLIYAGYRGKYNSESTMRAAAFKSNFSQAFKLQDFIFATFSYFNLIIKPSIIQDQTLK